MTDFQRIDENDRFGSRQAVFAAIYCPDAMPWADYPDEVDGRGKNVKVPLVLMQLRWDGKVGFPGGKVDEGEDKNEALLRELEEEINYSNFPPACHLVSYYNAEADLDIHCYTIRVSEAELKRILLCAQSGATHKGEVGGVFAIQVANYGDKGGFKEFRKNNFKASAGLELDMLIQREGWLKCEHKNAVEKGDFGFCPDCGETLY